jgi:hypothetical protein
MSRDRSTLALERLPDKAQSIVCSLASTPSCPAHLLLARVSKTWAAEGARHLQLDGARIELKLSCIPDSPYEQQEKEEQRLQGLADWLHQNGHLLNKLHIEPKPPQQQEDTYVLEACQAMPEVVAALAAAGRRRGGLRLQQLRLPAVPGTSMVTLCRALTGCSQLRALHLANSYSGQSNKCSWQTCLKLPAALEQLTQLTSLRLEGGLFRYLDSMRQSVDHILQRLPGSLVVLEVRGDYPDWEPAIVSLRTSSLQHLVSLRRLTLPDDTTVMCGSSESSNPLTGLTALTYLKCSRSTTTRGAPLLAPPNLVDLRAGDALPDPLETVSRKAALRSLTIILSPYIHRSLAQPLKQLTRLTRLSVYAEDEDSDSDDDAEEEEQSRAHQAAAEWGRALASLTGLHWLRVEPLLLSNMDISPLTALTRLTIHSTRDRSWHTQNQMATLLCSLAPARGRLQAVQLLGLPAGLQEGCREAAAAALGQVEVAFT